MANKYENIDRLNSLREKGAISEAEYQREKDKILSNSDSPLSGGNNLGLDIDTYCMLIHLSQLCGIMVPVAGMIVPIILWILNKETSVQVDTHGKIVINWIISSIIYTTVLVILCFLLIGIPLLIIFFVCNFVFIILGSLSAKSGSYWKYPFSLNFIKVDV